MKHKWTATDLTDGGQYIGPVEIQTPTGPEPFEVVADTKGDRICFGSSCNMGFIESGYIRREEGETTDDTLAELVADLETYYSDGPGYTSRIVFNERM